MVPMQVKTLKSYKIIRLSSKLLKSIEIYEVDPVLYIASSLDHTDGTSVQINNRKMFKVHVIDHPPIPLVIKQDRKDFHS